jgi:hypothetical protein
MPDIDFVKGYRSLITMTNSIIEGNINYVSLITLVSNLTSLAIRLLSLFP